MKIFHPKRIKLSDWINPPLVIWRIILILVNKANKIVILGMKGSGKSTLWKGLGGKKMVKANTQIETISKFSFTKKDGSIITIASTKDIGGEDRFVNMLRELIEKGSYVYYLASASGVYGDETLPGGHPYYQRIRSDFRKIDSVIKEKDICRQFGITVFITGRGSFRLSHPNVTDEELIQIFYDKVDSIKSNGPVGELTRSHKLPIRVVEFVKNPEAHLEDAEIDEEQMEIIKEEIG